MNRRDLLKRAFAISAAGLLVPERRVWALDRTMIPARPAVRKTLFNPDGSIFETGWFDASMPPFTKVFLNDNWWVEQDIHMTDETPFRPGWPIYIDGETMWVTGRNRGTLTVLRGPLPVS